MSSSIIWYLREFTRLDWIRKFIYVKTAPLETPPHFRGFPLLTGKECTHCFNCMMICPGPGAIEVLKKGDEWVPEIYPGHCIRCGLCVEACPEGVLISGRVLDSKFYDNTGFRYHYHIRIDSRLCMRCGNCSVACPVNKEIDPQLAAGGTGASDEVIMRITDGEMRVINEDKCTGCKTCEETCPNSAIRVARVVEGIHIPENGDGTEPGGIV